MLILLDTGLFEWHFANFARHFARLGYLHFAHFATLVDRTVICTLLILLDSWLFDIPSPNGENINPSV